VRKFMRRWLGIETVVKTVSAPDEEWRNQYKETSIRCMHLCERLSYIESEKFVDDIVDRINRKQLP